MMIGIVGMCSILFVSSTFDRSYSSVKDKDNVINKALFSLDVGVSKITLLVKSQQISRAGFHLSQ